MAVVPEQAAKSSGDWSQLLLEKVVFITGAGGAIGSAIACACASHGARVVIADINSTAINDVKTKILEQKVTDEEHLLPIELDVSNEESIKQAVQTVVDKWNTINVLVNKYF